MPKVNFIIPELQRDYERELRELYGAMLTEKNMAEYMNFKQVRTVRGWLSDLNTVVVSGCKRYRAGDVARKLYEATSFAAGGQV